MRQGREICPVFLCLKGLRRHSVLSYNGLNEVEQPELNVLNTKVEYVGRGGGNDN